MSRDQKLGRVRVVSSQRPAGNTPRRRRSDLENPIIEIAGDKNDKPVSMSMGGGEVWGISRPALVLFLIACGIGGIVAAIIGSL